MSALRILLVVGGGIAAYKSCELVRLIRRGGGDVTCVLSESAQQFVTPMTLAALSENPVHTTLWDLKNEVEMGHIQLSREADLVVVCPATADMMAKMAAGIADDLATTLILATNKPVLAVPAMNVRMWEHGATQRNVEWLRMAGVTVMDPAEGEMACGEFGAGRLPEPTDIYGAIAAMLGQDLGFLAMPTPELPPLLGHQPARDDGEGTGDEGEGDDGEGWKGDEGGASLGSLLASIIPRKAEDFQDPFEGIEETDEPAPLQDLPEPTPGGPILAKKGKAKAAPPTDPEAINHEVNPNQSPPEVFEEEAKGKGKAKGRKAVEPVEDPLEGQPDFDVDPDHRPLFGKHVLVTAGPTHEAIDPVRYIANRSSGKQGFAIAGALAALGARVTLVAGPVHLRTPAGVDRVDVESAREMADEVKKAMPADAAVMVAAVSDWRTESYLDTKLKKRQSAPPALRLVENPDILATIGTARKRPPLVVGFAAETDDVIKYATKKRANKGADWIVANDVSGDVMGGDANTVHIVSEAGVESWEQMAKADVAMRLAEKIADALAK